MDVELIGLGVLTLTLIVLSAISINKHKKIKALQESFEQQASEITQYRSALENFKNTPATDIANTTIESPNIMVIDEDDQTSFTAHEVFKFPSSAIELSTNDSLAGQTKNLVASAIKAGISIPNRTVELAFKTDIQEGLSSGAFKMMETKAGEQLADVVNKSTGKIAGKARVVQGGKVKQFAAGAFQIASIAVAQSHLADIDKSLKAINSTLDKIDKNIEIIERAKIEGALTYFEKVVEYIKAGNGPDAVSQAIATNIENCIKESHSWVAAVINRLKELNKEIESAQDEDKFGTGNTYTSLRGKVNEIKPIALNYKLLMTLNNASTAILGYLDPLANKYTRMDIKQSEWTALVQGYQKNTSQKAESLFVSKTLQFNANDTISVRKENIKNLVNVSSNSLMNELNEFRAQHNKITDHLALFQEEEIRLGVQFDDQNEVSKSYLLT